MLMVTTELIRIANVRALVEESGGKARAAERLAMDDSQLSQIAGPNPTRNIGPRLARRIETAFGKPRGWLDVPHGGHTYGLSDGTSETLTLQEQAVGYRRIPIIDSIVAGKPRRPEDPYPIGGGSDVLLTDLDLGENAFALEIDGESMLPEFRPGDRVIIDPTVQPAPGDYVAAANDENDATFKKYRPRGRGPDGKELFELIALNEDHESYRSDVGGWRILGTMIEKRSYRRRALTRTRRDSKTATLSRTPLFDDLPGDMDSA